jgi:D-lactate dehydrogenase (cytochrome)
MAQHQIRARAPRDEVRPPRTLDGDDVAVYLQDAAHTPGGHTPQVALPESEGEVVYVLRTSPAVLAVGAQSSLTGGATPFGERVLSLACMALLLGVGPDSVEAQAGLSLVALEEELKARGLFYPPAPTFRGATLGGTASTNAAGAATFKYGATRRWVESLTVVLASGDVLDVERGQCRAHPEGYFEVDLSKGGLIRVRVPTYRMPDVPKRSAGYHAESEMDLVDLLVGSEGTLGVITRLRVGVARAPGRFLGWVSFPSEGRALEVVGRLREASRATWASGDPRGIDIASIESLDRRCLELLREDGTDREQGLRLRADTETAILFEAELPPGADAAVALDEIGRLDDADRPDTPLVRLCLLLREAGVVDALEVALPGDERRRAQLETLREAVPMAVNHRIGSLQRARDPQVHKAAADMIVPFPRLPEMMARYRQSFAQRDLDLAIWGHVSDGNVHANVIPRSAEDVRRAEEAILECGDEAIRLGGCPLSEHGVGRSPTKQELLRRLYGDAGVAEMRCVKAALDPDWKLAPGVLFKRA